DVVADVLAGEAGDFLREAVELVARELMEAEISAELPRAAAAERAGDRGRGAGGVRQRRLHAQGRPSGRAAGPPVDDEGPRLRALPPARRAGERLPGASARGRLPVSVAGRQAAQGARTSPTPLEGARGRLRRARDGAARGDRDRPGRGRVGGVLARVPA